LHHLSETALTYNLIISTVTIKLLALKGKELIKNETKIKNAVTEQVINFNYPGCHLGSTENYDP
jgi:hypothetical protein